MDESVEEWLEHLLGEVPCFIRIVDGALSITPAHGGPQLHLTAKQVDALRWDRRFPKVPGLRVEQDAGISWQDYVEYLIYLESWGEWPEDKELRFNIGSAQISVGRTSALLVLLLEPIYREKDVGQTEFVNFSSIRIVGAGKPEDVFHTAMFYLNSTYLIPLRTAAVVRQLLRPDEIGGGPPFERVNKLARRRVRNRPAMKAIEPIILFNHAAAAIGHQSFLGHYRVLEYFFRGAVLAELARYRRDASKTEEDLLRVATIAREKEQLSHLLRVTLTAAEKKRLLDFAMRRGLVAKPLLDDLVVSLYAFRNSLVHAKEHEIRRTTLPDPLTGDKVTSGWNYVVAVCSAAAINRLNRLG